MCSCYVPLMVQRSTPQKKADENAFPIRVKVKVPRLGFGMLSLEMHAWLLKEIGTGNYAVHSATALGTQASGFYFRTTEAAQSFLLAFPMLELADGTRMKGYTSPAK